MSKTSIEWTDLTWNPTRGCAIVSEGCRNCYAMKQAHRWSGPGAAFEDLTKIGSSGPVWTGKARFVPHMLPLPLSWREPQRVFVDSMSDLFHEDISNDEIAAVFGVMAAASHHTFQMLTKRPKRMREWIAWIESLAGRDTSPTEIAADRAGRVLFPDDAMKRANFTYAAGRAWDVDWPLPNLWRGVSVEGPWATARIDELRGTPGHTFLSIEPLIARLGDLDLRQIDWVIVGGESGPGHRMLDLAWVSDVVDECRDAGVPVFVKQLGTRPELEHPKGGDPAEWPAGLRIREFPTSTRRAA